MAAAPAAPTATAIGSRDGHAAPSAPPAMSAEMAHEMGHGGKDLPAMVRGFALSDAEAPFALQDWKRRCAPPWNDREFFPKIVGHESTAASRLALS